MNAALNQDPHTQLRVLYTQLLTSQEHFDEFKQLLAAYPRIPTEAETEPAEAAAVRSELNDRIREWTQMPFSGLSAAQVQMWRAIIVDERFNIALSPWREANSY
jgi:hypothetical protein